MSAVARPVGLMDSKLLHRTTRWLFLIVSGIMIYHFFVIRSWGIGSFESFDRNLDKLSEDGHFKHTPFFDADGAPSFARYARSPAGRWLHIFPAGLWSVIAPFQLSPPFRSKYRAAHRYMGRLFILMSVAMSVGLTCLVFSGATKTNTGPAGFHQFKRGAGTLVLGVYFLATAMLAIQHARQKRYAQHRVWVLRHVAMGYSVHTMRLLMHLTLGWVAKFLPTYYDHTQAGSDLRDLVLGLYFQMGIVVCVGSTELWLRHTRSKSSRDDGTKLHPKIT